MYFFLLEVFAVYRCRFCFFHFVCFTGHSGPKQLTAIEEAGKIVRKRSQIANWTNFFPNLLNSKGRPRASLISANSALITWKTVSNSPFWPDPIEHGGTRDTSVALFIEKELVDPHSKTLPESKRKASRWARNWDRRRSLTLGYWGNPAQAQPDLGAQALNEIVDRVFPKIRAVLEGSNPNFIFRSWYSILPPNQSFFKAWLLVTLICLILAAWGLLHNLVFQI